MAWDIFTKAFWFGEDADPVHARFVDVPDEELPWVYPSTEEPIDVDDEDFVSVEDLVEEVDELMEQANELADEAEDIIDEILARVDELDDPDQLDTVEEDGIVYLRVWYPLHTEF
jgi:hypothetical protein